MSLILQNILGTATLALGVAFLISELRRRGLSKRSLFAYLCFTASSIFMSQNAIALLVSIGGLTALFLILYILHRRNEKRQGGSNQ